MLRWIKGHLRFPEYLGYQTVGSIFVNGGINYASARAYRTMDTLPLWGSPSIVKDTILTSVLLAALTVVCGTLFVRLDVRMGRVTPPTIPLVKHVWLHVLARSMWQRAALCGVLFPLVFCPPTIWALTVAAPDGMSYRTFLIFKLIYAIVLGMLVTPLNAASVLVRLGDRKQQLSDLPPTPQMADLDAR